MLANKNAAANLAVKDLKAAKKFYEGTLGLKAVGHEGDDLIAYRSGGSTLLVYKSQYAGTNKATAVTWTVGELLDWTARYLAQKQVEFPRLDAEVLLADRKRVVDVVVVVQGQTHLLEVVAALGPAGRLPRLLHRRQQQGDQDRDDRDHHQQFDQREPVSRGFSTSTGLRTDHCWNSFSQRTEK
jgi:catechol 2,3-dioxygenase-like lactoylglutathione lyase family enzyme